MKISTTYSPSHSVPASRRLTVDMVFPPSDVSIVYDKQPLSADNNYKVSQIRCVNIFIYMLVISYYVHILYTYVYKYVLCMLNMCLINQITMAEALPKRSLKSIER